MLSSAQSQEYKFAKAYIDGLGYRYELEVKADSDFTEAGNDVSKMNMASMRNGQRGKLKLREGISLLTPFKESNHENIRSIAEVVIEWYIAMLDNYEKSLNAVEDLINASSGSNPNVDMGSLSKRASEITAKQEYISESLFKANTLVAMTLIDQKPDENNHVSYLLLTSKERKELQKELELYFNKSLLLGGKKNQKYTVASAIILNKLLTDDHKSSDERTK